MLGRGSVMIFLCFRYVSLCSSYKLLMLHQHCKEIESLRFHHQRNNECKTGMMKEWYQKLHNNSSPDDVIICEVDFIKHICYLAPI